MISDNEYLHFSYVSLSVIYSRGVSKKKRVQKIPKGKGGDTGRHEQVTSLFNRSFSKRILQEIISRQMI